MKKRICGIFLCILLLIGLLPAAAISTAAQAPNPASAVNAAEPERYGYTTLSGNAKYVYEQLVAGVNCTVPLATIDLDYDKGVSIEDVRRAVSVFIGDYPECFWMRNKYTYSHRDGVIVGILPTYSFTGDALIEARVKLNSAVEAIMADLPNGSNYEKALYLHDLLAKRVEYQEVGEHQTAYGALVDGKAVCAGYAVAYHLLLREAGIRACTLSGVSYDPSTGVAVNHAWNMVWLDADTCVYTDVTWDDQGDELYHYYFNLSLAEIGTDHLVNKKTENGQLLDAVYFTLPACDHDDQSYFDRNGHTVTDQTTVQEAAAMFGAAHNGRREASICYTGSISFSAWVQANLEDLYLALGGGVGSYNCSFAQLGKEMVVTVMGNFPPATHRVELVLPSNTITNNESLQYVVIGSAMETVTVTAADGCYFPEDYRVTAANGITVQRKSHSQITVQGTPTAAVRLVLPALTAQAKQAMPAVSFAATGFDIGILSGVENGLKYTLDGENWNRISSADEVSLTNLQPGVLWIVREGNGTTVADSDPQKLVIERAQTPNLFAMQLAAQNGYGRIPTTSEHEYSLDGKAWTPCNGAMESLMPGTYHVRVKAQGAVLASDAQTLVISPYGSVPSGGNSGAEGGATGGAGAPTPTPKSSGCLAFTLGVEESALILTCLTAVLLCKKKLFAKAR